MSDPTNDRFEIQVHGDTVVIYLSGRVSAISLTRVQQGYNDANRALQKADKPGLVIDCDGIETITSMYLGSLMKMAVNVKHQGGRTVVSRLTNPAVLKAMSWTKLLSEGPMYDSVEAAIEAVSAP